MSETSSVIDATVLAHTIAHPARGFAWEINELAQVLGTSSNLLARLAAGTTSTLAAPVAQRISDAVGVHPNVLFAPVLSTKILDTSKGAA